MMMDLLKRRRDVLPYHMFDLAREAFYAKKQDKIDKIYHRGQERAWSGKEILPMLIEEHGSPADNLPEDKAEAIAHIFAIILWGELAAWKISAQLADSLVPLEAKMAATSQAHDEARHFYTIYDYLLTLGPQYIPDRIDPLSEKVLDMTIRTPSLCHKMVGMQLMIEVIALTIFQSVRKQRIEPVLADLLRYYEIDEARHVGLGVNYVPTLIAKMSKRELLQLTFFQFRLIFAVMRGLKVLMPHFETLGIPPRDILSLGKAKQFEVFKEMWGELGIDIVSDRPILSRVFDALDEIWIPEDPNTTTFERYRLALERFLSHETDVNEALAEEARAQFKDDVVLDGMGSAGSRWRKTRKFLKRAASKRKDTEAQA